VDEDGFEDDRGGSLCVVDVVWQEGENHPKGKPGEGSPRTCGISIGSKWLMHSV
jgi:hypothetical protein